MSAVARRVRDLASQISEEIRSIDRRKTRTATDVERKIADLVLATREADWAATSASTGSNAVYRRVSKVSNDARRTFHCAVRAAVRGVHVNQLAPEIVALGLADGLLEMVDITDDVMWDAAFMLPGLQASGAERSRGGLGLLDLEVERPLVPPGLVELGRVRGQVDAPARLHDAPPWCACRKP